MIEKILKKIDDMNVFVYIVMLIRIMMLLGVNLECMI